MMTRYSLYLSASLVVALLSLGAAAKADETLKYRAVMHGVSVQPQEVGDVEGHALTLVRFSGITEFPDGTTGTGYFVGFADYTKGAGKGFTYTNLTLEDGSVLWFPQDQKTSVSGTKAFLKEQSPSSVARVVLPARKAMERSLAHAPFHSQPARTYTLTTLST
jgi:hypothetical protein